MTTGLASKQSNPSGLDALCESGEVRAGDPLPWGPHPHGDGVNFALFSRNATRVRLEFYQNPDDASASKVIDLDPARHRTGDVWHVWVRGIASGQLYAYRIDGPYQPQEGQRFNVNKLRWIRLQPQLRHVSNWDFAAARGYDSSSNLADLSFSTTDNASATPKSVFTYEHFDWEGDLPPKHPSSDTVCYETHVQGFTIHPSSAVAHPGTFRGLTEKIPYFQDLGVTAVELMPVHEFNENELIRLDPITGQRLKNYWGYNPVAFLAPKHNPMPLEAHAASRRWSSARWLRRFIAPASKSSWTSS